MTLQEVCTSMFLELFKLFSDSYINLYRGVELLDCENNFTIAGIDVQICEIIYIPAGFQVLGSTFRVEKPQNSSYQRDRVFIWL